MGKKKIKNTYLISAHIDEIVIQTDDDDRYIFLQFPWYEYPLFSHRYVPSEGGKRTYRNTLPEAIENYMYEEFGGYYGMSVEENEIPVENVLF